MAHWDNVGRRERVESYFSGGAEFGDRAKWLGTVFLNEITDTIRYQISSQLRIGSEKDQVVGLEAGLAQSDETSYELQARAKLTF